MTNKIKIQLINKFYKQMINKLRFNKMQNYFKILKIMYKYFRNYKNQFKYKHSNKNLKMKNYYKNLLNNKK